MNVNLIKWSKRWLLAIVGVFAFALSGAQAQEAKIFTIKDFNEEGHAEAICKTARFFSVSPEGKLVWVEEGPFMNSMWYQIPVEGSETDFYLKNVATGQYVYRGYLTEGAEEGDEGFSTNQETKGWNWDFAYLSDEIAVGKEEFFQFRALPARWGWATDLTNVAGAIWENHGEETNPAFGFVINGQHKQTPGINGAITNVGGALAYPAAGIMRCTDNGQQGNAWTCVHFDEVSSTEFIKSKVTIETPSATENLLADDGEGNLIWTGMKKADPNLSAWYIIPVDPAEPDGDFYIKNASSGKYIYREGTVTIPCGGDWDHEPALLSEENEGTDNFVFRYVSCQDVPFGDQWGGRGWLVNMLDADESLDGKPFPSKGSAICLQGGPGDHDWFPDAQIGAINDGSNYWTTIKLGVPAEIMYYKVEFDPNNGGAKFSQSVAEDGTATQPAKPTRNDYDFLGWFLDEEDEEAFDFDTPITEDITLIAKWEYNPAPIVDRPERKVRILNWGNNSGIDGQFITYAYLGENEDGNLEWIQADPENINDYTAWIEIPVEGSNELNYYKNAATGKYIYRGFRLNEDDTPKYPGFPITNNEGNPASWRWDYALLSEEIDEENVDYYKFWPIPKYENDGRRAWGNRVHLANMGGVTAENPFLQTGAALYLGPINSNHGGDAFLKYPEVIMSSLDGNNGNVWASVLIEPVFTQVRIQDWDGDGKPSQYLRVNYTEVPGDDDDIAFLEWSNEFDDYTIWEELPVDGSTTEFYYRNYGASSRNHGTGDGKIGSFMYRETKDFAGDWGQAKALLSERYDGTDYYHFRKVVTPDWGGHCWLVNMADAEFEGETFVDKKAFVLSGINKDLDWMDYEYPEVLMHLMPDKGNAWSAVKFSDVAQTRNYTVTFNMSGGGGNQNIQVPEGDPIECINDPVREGYTFSGWFMDQECTEAYDCADPVVAAANMTFYAKWNEIEAPKDCTPAIKTVRIGNFQGATNSETVFWPRAYLKCLEKGELVWFVYGDRPEYGESNAIFGAFGTESDFDAADNSTLWYEIPVPGSNQDKYYKNVEYGFYLCLDLTLGAKYPATYEDENKVEQPHPKAGQFMEPSEAYEKTEAEPFPRAAWMWRGVKTSSFNHKTAQYKWRRLDTKDWGSQGWGACFVGNAYDVKNEARWGERSAFYALCEHKRLHTEANSPAAVGFPDRNTVFATTLGGDTHLTMGNAWTAASVWVSEETFPNPDCCQIGGENVECCGGDPECVEPCEGSVCVCDPTSSDCVQYCYQKMQDGVHDADCCGISGYSHADCGSTSAPEIGYLQYLKAFPNPTSNLLAVSGLIGGEIITVYNMNGQRVLNTVATGELTEISVSQLPKGAYIVKVSTGRGEWSTKFVVN